MSKGAATIRAEASSHAEAARPVGRALPLGRRVRLMQAQGEPMLWLTGAGLALAVAMIAGLLLLVLVQGLTTFWPVPVVRIETVAGQTLVGEVTREQRYEKPASAREAASSAPAGDAGAPGTTDATALRRLIRTGNFERTGRHFAWMSDFEVALESRPEWAGVFERMAWGRFYGVPSALLVDGKSIATGPAETWAAYRTTHDEVRARWRERRELERHALGDINRRIEEARLAVRGAELAHGAASAEVAAARAAYASVADGVGAELARLQAEIRALDETNARYQMQIETAEGDVATLALADIVRAYPANRLGPLDKLGVYVSRWAEFLSDEPREANSEGGVFPAIFGTVVMTLVMSLLVTPLGVLAALYLREYAKAGPVVSAVRIAVNNLAGVPSIVFGVFGLGFFCYIVGASLDQLLFAEKLPSPTYGTGGVLWASLTLALLTLPVVIVATEEALAAVPSSMREGSYACGASKWQTIRRIVLPRALPGILTGMILAVARGAGEVAPLMLVGAVKLAPELPVDGMAPFFHLDRSFMHLGFHIYDLGFQSQNSEAARPMVYTTTLLLVVLIASLNVAAIGLRSRLRRRFAGGQL